MKKLYEKNALTFAIAAIVIYVLVAGNLRGSFGDDSPLMLLGLAVLTVILGSFLVRSKLCGKYGLNVLPQGKPFLFFFPFWILSVLNLRGGIAVNYVWVRQLCALVSMALVGFLEEMIFRGLLYKAIDRENHTRAVIISSVTFGAGHIINLLTGSNIAETLPQICYACAIGFAFVIAYDRCGSLWPCIITHSLIDMTSTLANDAAISKTNTLICEVAIVVISLAYSFYLIKKFPRK